MEMLMFDIDRQPPRSIEAEKALLCSCLLSGECIPDIIDSIRPEYFYKTAHRLIFNTIKELHDQESIIDIITLSEKLTQKKVLDEIGGVYYLVELQESVPSAVNFESYCEIIRDKYIKREWISDSMRVLQVCYEDGDINNVSDILTVMGERENSDTKFIEFKELCHRVLDDITSRDPEKLTGITSGIRSLDAILWGFQKGELIIVAGRPSMGKTMIGLQVAREAALRDDIPVAIFTLEMTKNQITERILTQEAQVSGKQLKRNQLNEDGWNKISDSISKIDSRMNNIIIECPTDMSVHNIRRKARALKRKHQIKMIVIDYLQLVEGDGENRNQEVDKTTRRLKNLAIELDVPIILLSQLSRKVEERSNKRPMLSDLRDSGAIEQHTDVVLFLYRPEYYGDNSSDKDTKDLAEIIISKNRNGEAGEIIDTNFLKYCGVFNERINYEYNS